MDEAIYLRRPKIIPNKSSDYPLFLFSSVMIPATYWFHIWVVLPSLFSDYPVIYWTLFIAGHFCLHNVVGNFLAILIFDTSIRGRKMPDEKEPRVQYCCTCETYTPPRSFHCPSCDICILKRDHHCLFTGCCIGFYNHRFYIFFVFYVMLSTISFVPFNLYFLSGLVSITELSFFIIVFCPVLLFLMDGGSQNLETEHIYLIITILCVIAGVICLSLFYFHIKLILQGTVVPEMKRSIHMYNLGQEKNLQLVFGKRWYLTWISPYIRSPLICDGLRYPIAEHQKDL